MLGILISSIAIRMKTAKQYVEKFGKEDWIFTLNKGEELVAEMQKIYIEFSNWLGSWEM